MWTEKTGVIFSATPEPPSHREIHNSKESPKPVLDHLFFFFLVFKPLV